MKIPYYKLIHHSIVMVLGLTWLQLRRCVSFLLYVLQKQNANPPKKLPCFSHKIQPREPCRLLSFCMYPKHTIDSNYFKLDRKMK